MNLPTKLMLWAALSSFALVGAKAEDGKVRTADALLCGTADQAKDFATRHPEDLQAALPAANMHAPKSPCRFAQIAFMRGKTLDRVEGKNATYAVTEIIIVGIATPYGVMAIKPNVAYTVLKVKEEDA